MFRPRSYIRHAMRCTLQAPRAVSAPSVIGCAWAPLCCPRRGYREILKNTLSDTPSGYLQDPRAAPAQMVTYTRLTEASEAALEALRREEELQASEALAYPGYTSVRTDKAKAKLLQEKLSKDELDQVAQILNEELAAAQKLVGRTVVKPLTENQRQLLRWRQERERLEGIEKNAFIAETNGGRPSAVDESALVEVVVDPVDGTEYVTRRAASPSHTPASRGRFIAKDERGRPLRSADREAEDKPIAPDEVRVQPALGAEDEMGREETNGGELTQQDAEEEAFLAAAAGAIRGPVEVEVTMADVNHLRYILGLTYQRLGQFEVMETHMYAILAENPYAAEAIQSLLEVYTGLDTTSKIGDLIDFVARVDASLTPVNTRAEADGAEQSSSAALPSSSPSSEDGASPVPNAARAPDASEKATAARLSPQEVVIALLAEWLTETAALFCRDHGEGATSRFFLQALGPLAKRLGPQYTGLLLEALFQSFDAQHFVARAESDDPNVAASRELIYSVVIAFLKTLVSRDMAELVRSPVHFQFFTLSKLHAALRVASGGSRRQESYRVCERMLKLYRAHSSLYTARMAAVSRASVPNGQEASVTKMLASATSEAPASANSTTPLTRTEANAAVPAPAGALDDQDENYRIAYMDYVSDRAKESPPAVGRALCLAAMDEFPTAPEPWEVLALILHREDPKANLKDAILAAQRARELDPVNLSVILTLANFYKADNRPLLHEAMLDRFRLLSFMMENGASREDMEATVQEIAELEANMPRENEPDLIEETSRPMKVFNERYDMHTTYSMPINKEVRRFHPQPIIQPAQVDRLRYEVLHGKSKAP